MLRYRRYRVFVLFAVLTVLAFYHFSGSLPWSPTALKPEGFKPYTGPAGPNSPAGPLPIAPARETVKLDIHLTEAERTGPLMTPPPPLFTEKPKQNVPPEPSPTADLSSPSLPQLPNAPEEPLVGPPIPPDSIPKLEHGKGRLEVSPLPSSLSTIHWSKMPESFPVSSTIQLPTGSPKPVPKIQHDFSKKSESALAKSDRLDKLEIIKSEFEHAWAGYKEYAWLQDELAPVTNGSKNPFAGWGATLVDSLDSLWILGMMDEFEEAVAAVDKIDFTTSPRNDIPLFETTIRYLGGLIAAYDISDGKYRSLLDKAVELAEILMGAFDTPNRMPITYYYWKPYVGFLFYISLVSHI